MASLFQAYKIWDSNDSFNTTPTAVRTLTGINPRPGQLQPSINTNGDVIYTLVDNITAAAFPDVNGAKAISGIVTEDVEGMGVLTLWDVSGTGIAGVAYAPTTDTPADKLANFVFALNAQCLDCTASTQVIAGQFQGANYPTFSATTYCYTVVVTGDSSTTLARRQIQTMAGNWRIGEVTMLAANGTNSTYRVCLSAPIATVGIPASIPALTAAGIYAQTWTII